MPRVRVWGEKQEDAGGGREGPCLADPSGHGVCVWGPQGHVEHNHSIHNDEDGHRQEESQVPAEAAWAGGRAGLLALYSQVPPLPLAADSPDLLD